MEKSTKLAQTTEEAIPDFVSEEEITSLGDKKALEAKLLWKVDFHVLPIMFVFYFVSYLDRINIGNARIMGMSRELDLNVENRFNTAVLLFYVLYIPLEIPSNAILKRFRPSIFLPGLTFLWGIVTLCTGFVRNYQQLYALRVLLGLFEAGLVPGVVYVSSVYYRRHEYMKRLGIMYVATSVGGAVSGLVAWGISADLNGARGLLSWRWLFIIEGAATALIALLSPLALVDWPQQCRFFTPAEKEMIRLRSIDDQGGNFQMDTLDRHAMRRIACDWKIYLGALMYMGLTTSSLAMSFFLPTVLVEFGWRDIPDAQAHTVPVYVFTLGLTLLLSWLSDWAKHRYLFIMGCVGLATLGYGMLLNVEHLSKEAKYAACFFIAGGGLCSGPLIIGFLSNNLAGHWKKATGSALQVSFAGFAGIIGSYIFKTNEAPTYTTGFATGLAMAWLTGIAATLMAGGMWFENKKRERGERNDRLLLGPEQSNNLGDDHPSFRFSF